MDLNMPTILLQTFGFLALLLLLKRFLYAPLLAVIDKRTQSTEKLLKQAEQTHEEAQSTLVWAKKELDQARAESQKIRHLSKLAAEEEREAILERGRRETEMMISRAKSEIEQQSLRSRQELKAFVADAALLISEKLLMREISQADRKRYISTFNKDIEQKV